MGLKALTEQAYIEELWHLAFHQEDDNQAMTFLTAYYDDSGSDETSPITTIGGPVMSKEQFKEFGREWSELLDSYRVPNPLHMTDFVRPFGKNIGMYPEMKLSLVSRISHFLFLIAVNYFSTVLRSTTPLTFASAQAAVSVADWVGGPGSQPVMSEPRHTLLAGRDCFFSDFAVVPPANPANPLSTLGAAVSAGKEASSGKSKSSC